MRRPPTVFMFAGQGSQSYHMGRELFEREPAFRSRMLEMDAVVRRLTGRSTIEAIYDDRRARHETFDRTALTHPAIFMVEYALARTLIERHIEPDYVLGASLGAFAAAAVAGCLEPEAALTAVVRQASAIETSCRPGGMIAVLASPALAQDRALIDRCETAAVNLPGHFVVAAIRDQLQPIQDCLRDRQVAFQPLPVGYAFHSRWIDEARAPFLSSVARLACQPPRVPLVCCAGAAILNGCSREYLWTVARQPMYFGRTISYLEDRGPHTYVDVGPSPTLATLTKRALPAASMSRVWPTLGPDGRDVSHLDLVSAQLGVSRCFTARDSAVSWQAV